MLFHQKKCIYFLEITGRIGLCSLLLPLIIANTAYGCSVVYVTYYTVRISDALWQTP